MSDANHPVEVTQVWGSWQHSTADTALVVPDYPYGFKSRTQIRYWIETNPRQGQRFCSQTLNPKTGQWNSPKKKTYAPIVVLYQEAGTGHIKHDTLSAWWDLERLWAFEERYALALTGVYESSRLKAIKEGATRRAAAKL